MKDHSIVPANEIWYTTSDGEPIELSYSLEEIATSNTYNDGKGIIVLDNPIVEIVESAFEGCENLQEIVIPEGVTEIGQSAFDGCTSLKKIVIPEGVTNIASGAFYRCKSLHEIDIPSGITYIDSEVFGRCTGLRKIVIPSSVETIYDGAFDGCTGLEEVVIPSSVTRIGTHAFVSCRSLKAIYVPKGKVDFYKDLFPANMRWLIVEEGSALPVKAKIVAKDVHFDLSLRVTVLDNETDSYILSMAKKKLEDMSEWEILELVHFDSITDSKEPYDKDNDYNEEDDGGYMWDDEDEDEYDEDYED